MRVKPVVIFWIIGFLLLAVAALLAGYHTTGNGWLAFFSNMIQGTGMAVITVALLDFLWNALGGEPITRRLERLLERDHLMREAEACGLKRIVARSDQGDYGSGDFWLKRIAAATKQVDLMAFTLKTWTSNAAFAESICELARRHVQVRLLSMNADNPHFTFLMHKVRHTGNPDTDYAAQRDSLVVVRQGLREAHEALARVRQRLQDDGLGDYFDYRTVKSGVVLNNLCRTDHRMTVIQYTFSQHTTTCPLLELEAPNRSDEGGELFTTYERDFEMLWASNAPSPTPLASGLPPKTNMMHSA